MKKIDAHAHIGDFGGWAGVGGAPEQLIALMDEYDIEKTVLCARDHTGNEGVAQAAEKYQGRFIPLVYLNPLEGEAECRRKVEAYVDGQGFRGIKLNPLRHAYVADDVILDLLRQFDKEGAVSGYAHHQPGIVLWALLGFPQRVSVHHVKLNML